MHNLEVHLPDPYQHPYDYFQVAIPEELPIEIELDNISDTGPMPKIATFKKVKYVEANGARSLKWIHLITQ